MAESLRAQLRRVLNRLIQPAGVRLVRKDGSFEMSDLLMGARVRGLEPRTVIDVGASDGVWSLRAHRYFPKAGFLLFEPLEERRPALEALRQSHGFDFVAAAAGDKAGSVGFTVDPALDGSAVVAAGEDSSRTVPVETIDAAVAQRGLHGPFCLKLDTHGFELPVLSGAARVLGETELLVIEAYNFTLCPGCLRFHELCAWLEERRFRCCDIADPMRRPADGVLWQMDLAFAPAHHAMFASARYA